MAAHGTRRRPAGGAACSPRTRRLIVSGIDGVLARSRGHREILARRRSSTASRPGARRAPISTARATCASRPEPTQALGANGSRARPRPLPVGVEDGGWRLEDSSRLRSREAAMAEADPSAADRVGFPARLSLRAQTAERRRQGRRALDHARRTPMTARRVDRRVEPASLSERLRDRHGICAWPPAMARASFCAMRSGMPLKGDDRAHRRHAARARLWRGVMARAAPESGSSQVIVRTAARW